ncbi:LexA family protein [Vibrio navarrensis]|uniref:LexA family transcriptional regulator n=1 Tax=Vibrio navarrensis TaxID=29495 RepID=A0AAJ4LT11_9VIBR|nr:LexA family transcriptional regulator [Vibrio navarrensis]MBE4617350.1 LexA family transcriptional repressor [Vibrio navarrensis]QPL52433.1 LexA family transcriptional regulator [Vibrio navarrensis]
MKMNWNDLVKARMKEIGMTQDALAEKMGLAQASIARYLNKKREPDIDTIAKIMKCVGLDQLMLSSDGYVEYPDEVLANVSRVKVQLKYQNSFPLLSSVQAGAWSEAVEPYRLDEISHWYETTERTSERSFWLEVEGDSMTSATGVSFPEGTLVLVDTERDYQNGSLVVAKLTDVNSATFKKLVIDAGQKYLKPLNTAYQMMPINGNCRIIGVVVDAKLKLF